MKRRVCDSCFFFEAAGLNNSGWCRHPDRQFDSGVRLVVRGNEIACRNGWDADLWVSKDIDPSDALGDAGDPVAASPESDQITSIIPARYEPAPAEPAPPVTRQPEDIVVGHAPYSGYTAPEKDARDLVTNPRAAILRAREQFKSRQKREGRISDLSDRPPLLVDATNDFPASDWNLDEDDPAEWMDEPAENAPFLGRGAYEAPRPQINVVPPVAREEILRPYPTITSFAEDDERFESVPDPAPAPRTIRRTPEPAIDDVAPIDMRLPAGDSDALHFDADDDAFWHDDGYVEHRPRRESIVNRLLRERRERQVAAAQRQDYDDWHDEVDDTRLPHRLEVDQVDRRDVLRHARHEDAQLATPYQPAAPTHPRTDVRQYDDFIDDYLVEDRAPIHEVEVRRHSQPDRRRDERVSASRPAPDNGHWDEGWSDDALIASGPLHSEPVHHVDERRLPPLAGDPGRDRDTWRSIDPIVASHQSPGYRDHDISDRLHTGDDRRYARDERASLEAFPADEGWPEDDLPRWDDAPVRSAAAVESPTERAPLPFDESIPRICRTCRDYRPSELPDRGWCNNTWAFRHRRMVDADTLSCGTSALGSWWTANDGFWQKPSDVSRHAQETPLLDRLLASRYDHFEGQRRAGGSSGR